MSLYVGLVTVILIKFKPVTCLTIYCLEYYNMPRREHCYLRWK